VSLLTFFVTTLTILGAQMVLGPTKEQGRGAKAGGELATGDRDGTRIQIGHVR
jgi:hypothetical protein